MEYQYLNAAALPVLYFDVHAREAFKQLLDNATGCVLVRDHDVACLDLIVAGRTHRVEFANVEDLRAALQQVRTRGLVVQQHDVIVRLLLATLVILAALTILIAYAGR